MKNKTFKKSLSVIMAVFMLLSCWVFIPGEHNHAQAAVGNVEAHQGEVTGYVTVDPVIYIHGDYTGTQHDISDVNQFDYLMYGSVISDGSYAGEYSTAVSVSGKTIQSVTVTDTNATLGINGGVLTGNLGGGYGGETSFTTNSTATLKFTFTDGTYEYHKLAVKPNPVAQHAVVHSYGYNTSWNGSVNTHRLVTFEALARGSVGSAGGTANSGNSGWTATGNFPVMYSPMNSAYDVWTSSNTVYCDGMSSGQDPLGDETDKDGGIFVAQRNKGATCEAQVTTNTAQYYLDLSSSKNLGVTHTAGSNNWSIKMFVGNVYCAETASVGGTSTVTASFNVVAPSNLVASGAFDSNANISGDVTVSGTYSSGSSISGTFTTTVIHDGNSRSATGKINIPYNINVVNKANLRNRYNEIVAQKLQSGNYTMNSWNNFKNALLQAEVYLNNSTANTSNETTLLNNLNAYYAALKRRNYELSYDNLFSFSEWAATDCTNVNDTNRGTITYDIDNGTITAVDNSSNSNNDFYTEYGIGTNYYKIPVKENTEYYLDFDVSASGGQSYVFYYSDSGTVNGSDGFPHKGLGAASGAKAFTTPAGCTQLGVRFGSAENGASVTFSNIRVYEASKKAIIDDYKANGIPARTAFDYGEALTADVVASPARAGFTSGGWIIESDYSLLFGADEPLSNFYGGYSFNASWIVYSDWTENIYNIAFNANGGTGTKPGITGVAYTESKALKTNTEITRTGYTFTGWNTKADGTGTAIADGATVSKLTPTNGATVTLYAQWKANNYRVLFDNLFDFSQFEYGRSTVRIEESTDTGFTVTATAADGNTGFSYNIPVEPGKTYKLSADVAFDNSAGGGGYDIYIHTLDSAFAGETSATPDTSNGAGREGNVYISLTGQTTETKPYIRFTAGNNTAYVRIRFDANNANNKLTVNNIRLNEDGKVADGVSYELGQDVTFGSSYGTLPTPTRAGYTFAGWVNADGNAETSSSVVDYAGTETLYSTWTINKYKVEFVNAAGTVVSTQTLEYGETPTVPSTNTAADYDSTNHYAYSWPTVSNVTGDITYKEVKTPTAHSLSSSVTTSATCTSEGVRTYKCSACAYSYTEPISVAAHTEVIDAAVAATCSATGLTEGKHCSVCGTVTVAQQTVEKLPHTEVTVPTVESTCTSTGLTAGKKCSVCGTVTVAQTTTDKKAHSMGEWSQTKAPTCITAGEKTRKCENCTYTETEAVAATGEHVYGKWESSTATEHIGKCTKDDNCTATVTEAHTKSDTVKTYDSTYHYYKCEKCDAYGDLLNGVFTKNLKEECYGEGITYAPIDGDNAQHKAICKCGNEKNAGHAKEKVEGTYVAPGCLTTGEQGWRCTACGYTYTEILASLGHTEGEAVKENIKDSTCYAEGSYDSVVYCTVCKVELRKETVVINKKDHTPASAVKENINKASCTADGSYEEVVYCSVAECKAQISREEKTIPMREHVYGEWQETKAPTYNAAGEQQRSCTNTADELYEACTHTETKTVPMLVDGTAPTGTVIYKTTVWDKFLETITFGIYVSEDIELVITAEDEQSGVASIEYIISDTALTEEAVKALDGWTEYTDGVKISKADAQQKVVYARITNKQNGVTYLSTDGFTFDITAPVIEAVTECTSATITVTETNISSVTVDGETVTLDAENKYTLNGAGSYVITVIDKAGNITTETVEIKGHIESVAVEENRTESSCTVAGSYESVVYCSACGYEISRTKVDLPLAPHTEGEVKVENKVDATCTVDGSYDNAVYCTECNAELSRNTVVVPQLGHTEGEAVEENIKDSTCYAEGSYDSVVYCTVCKVELRKETVVINKKDHTPAEAVKEKIVDSTCYAEGSYDEVVYCSVEACKYEISRTPKTVEKKEHTREEAVIENNIAPGCETDGSYDEVVYCSVCKAAGKPAELSRNTVVVPALKHDYKSVVTPPTCTQDGYTTHTCSRCNDTYTDTPVTKLGHTFGEWDSNNDGTHTRECTVCKDEAGRIETVNCSYGEWTETKAPTCTESGEKQKECPDCKHIVTEAVNPLNHIDTNPVDGECDRCREDICKHETKTHTARVEATCIAEGNIEYWTCEICDRNFSDEACTKLVASVVIPVDSTNHVTITAHAETSATCLTVGYTAGTFCEDCDKWISGHAEIPTIAHKNKEYHAKINATCISTGTIEYWSCPDCNKNFSDEECTTVVTDLTIQIDSTKHVNTTSYDETPSTCTAIGYTAGTYCEDCKKWISGHEEIKALDHAWGNWTETKKATCLAAGEERRDCGRCDAFETNVLTQLGHSYTGEYKWDNASTPKTHSQLCANGCNEYGPETECTFNETVKAPTCAENGYTTYTCTVCTNSYDANYTTREHVYVYAAGNGTQHVKTCKYEDCKNEVTENCSGGIAYCNALAVCENCNTPWGEKKADNHASTETYKENEKANSCGADGYTGDIYYSCCDALKENGEVISATGEHKYGDFSRNDDETTHSKVCSVCNDVVTENCVPGEMVTENTVAPTCTKDGSHDEVYYCTVCKAEISRASVTDPQLGHSYTSEVTPPTCTQDGYTTHTCSRCDDTYTDTPVTKLGHTFGEWDSNKDGTHTRECTVCKDEAGRIETVNCSYGEWTETKAPTCTESGEKQKECTICKHIVTEAVNPLNHIDTNLVDGECDRCGEDICKHETKTHTARVEATCIAEGNIEYWTCEICNRNFSDEECTNLVATVVLPVDSTNHVTTTAHAETPATCLTVGYTAGTFCEDCDKWISGHAAIPTTAHKNKEYHAKINATCISTGTIEYWSCPDCNKNFSDEECTTVVTDLTIEIDKDAHDLKTTAAKEATCTEIGWAEYVTCQRGGCGYTTYEAIPATAHKNKVHHAKINATCISEGTIEYWYCPDCKLNFSDEACTTTVTDLTIGIDLSNHASAETYTVGEKPSNCGDDGYTGDVYHSCCDTLKEKGEIIPSVGEHNFEIVEGTYVQASCVAVGYVTKKCDGCGAEIKETIPVDTGAHNFSEIGDAPVSGEEPNCIKEGISRHYCQNEGCTFYRKEILPKTEHKYEATDVPATCVNIGYIRYDCSEKGCTASYDEYYKTDANGEKELIHPLVEHSYRYVSFAPTCEAEGYTEYICTVCNYGYVDAASVVPAKGHTDKNEDGVCDTCKLDAVFGSCTCICHSTNWFINIIYKIINFIWKLLKMSPVCDCGVAHY